MEVPSSTVRVVLRVRPFIDIDEEKDDRCVRISKEESGAVDLDRGVDSLRYKFDAAYDVDVLQETIFKNEVEPTLPSLFEGLNNTIFCYGMTGAGKTFTMQGPANNPGIIPRVLKSLFALVESKKSSFKAIKVKMSYFEIYNNKLFDLLKFNEKDLPIREDPNGAIFVQFLHEEQIRSVAEFEKHYDVGKQSRKVAATKLNATSSRSHAILLITMEVKVSETRTLTSKLHLIDLAGSEDNRKTNNTGVRLVESSSINTSLFVLGKVVEALNKGDARIPYRDSKLTRLLQDSLGGSSRGILIANVAPGRTHFGNSDATLRFASKSRLVVNNPVVNERVEVKKVVEPPKPLFNSTNLKKWSPPPSFKGDLKTSNPEELAVLERRILQRIEAKLKAKPTLPSSSSAEAKAYQERLTKLEKILSQNGLYQGSAPSKTQWDPSLLTPNTKSKIGQDSLKKAKDLEKSDADQSLLHYKQAAIFMPQSQLVAAKIKRLEKESVTKADETYSLSAQELEKAREMFGHPMELPLSSFTNNYPNNNNSNKKKEKGARVYEDEEESDSEDDEKDEDFQPKTKKSDSDVDEEEEQEVEKPNPKRGRKPAAASTKELNPKSSSEEELNKVKKRGKTKGKEADNKNAIERIRMILENLNVPNKVGQIERILATINFGTEKQLRELKTVGQGRAKSIMSARKEDPTKVYRSVEDLLAMEGWGEKGIINLITKNLTVTVVSASSTPKGDLAQPEADYRSPTEDSFISSPLSDSSFSSSNLTSVTDPNFASHSPSLFSTKNDSAEENEVLNPKTNLLRPSISDNEVTEDDLIESLATLSLQGFAMGDDDSLSMQLGEHTLNLLRLQQQQRIEAPLEDEED